MPIWKITYAGGVHIGHAPSQAAAVMAFEQECPGQGGSIMRVEQIGLAEVFDEMQQAAARARRDE